MLKEVFRIVLLLDVAAVHEYHAGGYLTGEAHLVGHHHHGHAVGETAETAEF